MTRRIHRIVFALFFFFVSIATLSAYIRTDGIDVDTSAVVDGVEGVTVTVRNITVKGYEGQSVYFAFVVGDGESWYEDTYIVSDPEVVRYKSAVWKTHSFFYPNEAFAKYEGRLTGCFMVVYTEDDYVLFADYTTFIPDAYECEDETCEIDAPDEAESSELEEATPPSDVDFSFLEDDYDDDAAETKTATRVRLTVPLVRQGPSLCGPACIEMVFRYWGETRYTQYDIARGILYAYPDVERVVDCGILEDDEIDWEKYPGTGTSVMRNFLQLFAPTINKTIRQLPLPTDEALAVRDEFFETLKQHLRDGTPVIVHQYSKLYSGGHYRLVTGYDDEKREVYMNDPARGKIKMTYEAFFEFWNVAGNYMPYNSIAFNVKSGNRKARPVRMDLSQFTRP